MENVSCVETVHLAITFTIHSTSAEMVVVNAEVRLLFKEQWTNKPKWKMHLYATTSICTLMSSLLSFSVYWNPFFFPYFNLISNTNANFNFSALSAYIDRPPYMHPVVSRESAIVKISVKRKFSQIEGQEIAYKDFTRAKCYSGQCTKRYLEQAIGIYPKQIVLKYRSIWKCVK